MDILHVRRGRGAPLVLLPGTSSSWLVWQPVLDRLARERDAIALDLPGFGGSTPLEERPDPPALARAVARLLDELGLERPHVAGNSLGGGVALELARAGRAASVCAISPIGFWTAREYRFTRWSLDRNVRSAASVPPGALRWMVRHPVPRTLVFGQFFGRPWRMSPDEAEALAGVAIPGYEAIVDAYADYRYGPSLAARIDCPVTVAWGTRDHLLIPRQGRRVPRVLPQARLVWLRGLGHVPTWDDPEQVAALLLEASSGSAG
jgi:pimeloyl-ACP methyl ester carboxylesterase